MKNIFLIAFILFIVIGCSGNSNNQGPSYSEINYEVMQDMSQETPEEEDLLMGDFVSGSHVTTGKAVVNEEQTVLSLLNFKTDDGPKLLLYLSIDAKATEYVDLGELKGISGDYTYNIPSKTDLEKFKYADIWCIDFAVSFGRAELK